MVYSEPRIDADYLESNQHGSGNELRLIAHFFKLCIEDYLHWKRKQLNKQRVSKRTDTYGGSYGTSAEIWIFNPPAQDYPFSFENCCLYLNVDPNRIRNEIRKRAQEPGVKYHKNRPDVIFGRRIDDMEEGD